MPATPVWKTIGESTLDVNYIEKIDGYRIPVRRHQSYLDTQYELEDQATQNKIQREIIREAFMQ